MIRKLLPILLSVVAFLGGAAAGDMLGGAPAAGDDAAVESPEAATAAADAQAAASEKTKAETVSGHDASAADAGAAGSHGADGHAGKAADKYGSGTAADPAATAWYQFPAQFFVPILHDGRLDSTMVLSLSAEMPGEASETVYAHEIKLRDALLRQLLIHANTGGFDGNFTSEAHLRGLRTQLVGAAQAVVPEISAILIGDIARQER